MDLFREIEKHYHKRVNSFLLNYRPTGNRSTEDLRFSGKRKLTIAYMMNHVRVCGGVKIIFEHTERLIERGHHVYLISHAAKPDWYELKAEFITVPEQIPLVQYIPADVDIVVCTVADQVPQCFLLSDKPVVMFEQGDTYIFEFEKLPPEQQHYFKNLWNIPVPVFGVSKFLNETLKRHFGVHGTIIPNSIDPAVFYPRISSSAESGSKPVILFVGREDVPFKGIKDIRKALEIVRESGREFDEIWVTPVKPESPFDGKLYVNPRQTDLGHIYRMSDIFVSGSYYESFSLPPMEAMACGCAVVSTNSGGILEYAQNGVNCLLGEAGNPESLAKCIIELIDDRQKREFLVRNGYQTVKRFDWNNIMDQWESHLSAIVESWHSEKKAELLIKKLPPDLHHDVARSYMQNTLQQMKEDFCLWLVEGEEIADSDIERIKHILSHDLAHVYALQVIYWDDIPEHPVVRLENRIYKRGTRLSDADTISMILPVRLKGANDSCFLPYWLREARLQYLNRDFKTMISQLKAKYPTLSPKDQPVAIKWLSLALMEQELDQDCIKLLSQAVQSYPSYSDLSYLLGRILLYSGNVRMAANCFKLARLSGTAALYDDYFLDVEQLCDIYLKHTALES